MANDQAVFSFELNESLYFEQGQEVDEIRGISLDPEISIQPFHDYISIRGVIELRGEYVKADIGDPKTDGAAEWTDDYHAKRFVEQVMDTEDGEAKFLHRFPVEISVPSYRVENLDEVKVSIDSFDYDLSGERQQLAFTSTIAIYGINEQENLSGNEMTNTLIQNDEQTFDFDIKDPHQDLNEDTPETIDPTDYQDLPTLSDANESSDEESSSDRWKNKKAQSLTDFLQQKPESTSDTDLTEASSSSSENLPDEQDHFDFVENNDSQEPIHAEDNWESSSSSINGDAWENRYHASSFTQTDDEVDATEINVNENPPSSPQIYENTEPEKNETADVSYLSDMFRDEEEHFSRMRVCIVQEKDTLELIADRYNTSTLHLIKQNHLEDDTISEGQLLYIPDKK